MSISFIEIQTPLSEQFHMSAQPLAIQSGNKPSLFQNRPSWDVVELSPLVDFRDIFHVIKRRIWWLLLIPFLCVVSMLVYLLFIATPYYKSTALIFIDPMFDSILQIEKVSSVAPDLDSLNSMEKAILSDSMILRVVDKLNLREDRSFLPKSLHKYLDRGQEISSSQLLAEIRKKRFEAGLIRPTRLLEVSVYDTDAERARIIAQAFVDEFEAYLGEQKQGEANQSVEELRNQADIAYTRALDAEKALEDFRMEHASLTVEQDHQLFAERLTRVGDELNAISGKVLDLRSKVETLKEVDPNADPVKVINLGNFAELDHVSSLLDQRTNAKANLAAVEQQYTTNHPRYIEAKTRFVEADTQLQELATNLKASVSASLEAAEMNEKLLTQRVADLQKEYSKVKEVSSEFRAIQQKVETEWAIHQSLRQKIGETALMSQQPTHVTKLMSAPIKAYKPAKPSKPVFTLAAGFFGCLLSLGFVGIDLLRGGPVANSKQLERQMHVPVATNIPRLSPEFRDEQLIQEMTSVLLSVQHRNAPLLHMTSVHEDPEALRVAVCLASAAAFYGYRTLVISVMPGGDPHSMVDLVPRNTGTENLYFLRIPASFFISPRNAWELLSPHTEDFSRIVIETTTIPQQSQVPALIASFSNASLLLVQREKDDRKEVEETVRNLSRNSEAQISLILQG